MVTDDSRGPDQGTAAGSALQRHDASARQAPDPSNPLPRLVDPMGWIAVAATAVLMAAALAWAWAARIELSVHGAGVLLSERGQREVRVLLTSADGARVRSGMTAYVTPDGSYSERDGHVLGTVGPAGALPLSAHRLQALLDHRTLAEKAIAREASMEACVRLQTAEGGPAGAGSVRWTLPGGASVRLFDGQGARVTIVTRRVRPIALLLPSLGVLLDR